MSTALLVDHNPFTCQVRNRRSVNQLLDLLSDKNPMKFKWMRSRVFRMWPKWQAALKRINLPKAAVRKRVKFCFFARYGVVSVFGNNQSYKLHVFVIRSDCIITIGSKKLQNMLPYCFKSL